ncbi:MAG TPA: hypothetical protein IAD02_01640 [Candidatus Enterousia intestinigallinarum]|uniref:Uncharacterized protein n=1 Tax=Candidatus Enterousia intestinigallinarum TaxID=2840790 RepID=A0A9D1FFG8_9PROT|nr:hypothetical protein [Candidatus Enterousia intestinigallinarum]
MSTIPKYPDITVKVLNFGDDKAAIIIACLNTLKQHGIIEELPQFADYISKAGPDKLIERIKDWFNVE